MYNRSMGCRTSGPFCLIRRINAGVRWLVPCLALAFAGSAQFQPEVIEGHVLHASSRTHVPGATVVAWPCGNAALTDASGTFAVSCSGGIDSLTVSCLGFQTQVVRSTQGHVDIWLQELKVNLRDAVVETMQWDESESRSIAQLPLIEALDRTPGLQSLDLGAGSIQPVIRGLLGSRIAVVEDGVPQQGARWGSDHGVLVAPELQVVSRWVPGGGHVWLGPEAMGGGLRFESPSLNNTSGVQTTCGSSARAGAPQAHAFALHTSTKDANHWHVGASLTAFGTAQIPQRTFTYIGRTYALESPSLPNTGGRSIHGVVGWGRRLANGADFSWNARVSDVHQGLFPGIVGVPQQGDLASTGSTFAFEVPVQRASRLSSMMLWKGRTTPRGVQWKGTWSAAWNRRVEYAPPHAHGWGPEPTTTLSLSLEEHAYFGEVRRSGAHGTVGWQAEFQQVETGGWEFLVPSHTRLRNSVAWQSNTPGNELSARFDLVHAQQSGFERPLYNASGDSIGRDVRALPFEKWVPGAMAAWQRRVSFAKIGIDGRAALAVHGRVPSNHEWGANGIHHGTFRFEQGNPDLRTEWTVEGRYNLEKRALDGAWSWEAATFLALHDGFISLAPSGAFAPIAHAGQVYAFRANTALRTGLEARAHRTRGRQTWALDGSLLGQWELPSGLGLPFTTPAQCRVTWTGETARGVALEISGRAIARAALTARNENPTPGTALLDVALRQSTGKGQWALRVHNALNTAWLDHISAYRALGIAAQGRWVQLSFNTTSKHSTQKENNHEIE